MEFLELLGKKISELFLVIWTPYGEERLSDVDMCFGFVFNGEQDKFCVISVHKDELWSPHIVQKAYPVEKLSWVDFYSKIDIWMKSEDENCAIESKYFDVTHSELFKEISGAEIIGIELICVEGNDEPFGVKMLFENDYIISTPISDGNTVETSRFNQNRNIEVFSNIGKVKFINVT